MSAVVIPFNTASDREDVSTLDSLANDTYLEYRSMRQRLLPDINVMGSAVGTVEAAAAVNGSSRLG